MSRAYGYSAFGGPDLETWFERGIPTPGPSELVIEVRAAGVNPADAKMRSGLFADPDDMKSFPLVLGLEAAGLVTAVGEDVDGFREGEEVVGKPSRDNGTFAEHAVIRAADAVAKPQQVSHVHAAALPVAGGTAWDCIEALGVTEGSTVLINGVGGGVGVVAAQLCRDRGAAVFGTGSGGKRALAESLGVTFVAYQESVVQQMRDIMPGGVDAVLDCVGGESLREVAILVTDPARIISIADPQVEHLGGHFLFGSSAGLATLLEMVVQDKLDPKVLQTYPFDEAAEAMRAVESGHVLGKVVIDMAQTTSS